MLKSKIYLVVTIKIDTFVAQETNKHSNNQLKITIMKLKIKFRQVGVKAFKDVIIEVENETLAALIKDEIFTKIMEKEKDLETTYNKRYYLKGIEDIDVQ